MNVEKHIFLEELTTVEGRKTMLPSESSTANWYMHLCKSNDTRRISTKELETAETEGAELQKRLEELGKQKTTW